MPTPPTRPPSSFPLAKLARALQRWWALAWACLASTGSMGAWAQPVVTHYFDGPSVRTVQLEPRWVADIAPTTTLSTKTTEVRVPGADTPQAQPLISLRRSSDPAPRHTDPSRRVSPVYREGDSPAGRLMALPGGVMVQFKPDWSDAQIQRWADVQGLQLLHRLNLPGQWHLVATEAGTAALTLANQIHTSGDVVSARPNWWRQTVHR